MSFGIPKKDFDELRKYLKDNGTESELTDILINYEDDNRKKQEILKLVNKMKKEKKMTVVKRLNIPEYGTMYEAIKGVRGREVKGDDKIKLFKTNLKSYIYDKKDHKFHNPEDRKYKMRIYTQAEQYIDLVKTGIKKSVNKTFKHVDTKLTFVKKFTDRRVNKKNNINKRNNIRETETNNKNKKIRIDLVFESTNEILDGEIERRELINTIYYYVLKIYRKDRGFKIKDFLENNVNHDNSDNITEEIIDDLIENNDNLEPIAVRPALYYYAIYDQDKDGFKGNYDEEVRIDLSNELATKMEANINRNDNKEDILTYFVGKINTSNTNVLKSDIKVGKESKVVNIRLLNSKAVENESDVYNKNIMTYSMRDAINFRKQIVTQKIGSDDSFKGIFDIQYDNYITIPKTHKFAISFYIKEIEKQIVANGRVEKVQLSFKGKWYVVKDYICEHGDCLPIIFYEIDEIINFYNRNKTYRFDKKMKKLHNENIKNLKNDYDEKEDILKIISNETKMNIMIFDEDVVPILENGNLNTNSILRTIEYKKDTNNDMLRCDSREEIKQSMKNNRTEWVYIVHCREREGKRVKNHYSLIYDFKVKYDDEGDLKLYRYSEDNIENGDYISDIKLKLKKIKQSDCVNLCGKFKPNKGFTYVNYDIEAVLKENGDSLCYSVAYLIMDYKEIESCIINNEDDVNLFKKRCKYLDLTMTDNPLKDFIDEILEIEGSVLLVGFNSARYDNIFLFNTCIEEGLKMNPFYFSGNLFDLKIEKKSDIKCFDLFRFVNSSLKEGCINYDTLPKKVDGFCHKIPQNEYYKGGVNGLKNWLTYNKNKIVDYNKIDVLACTSLFIKIRNVYLLQTNFDIINSYTIAGFAEKILKKGITLHNKNVENELLKNPLYRTERKIYVAPTFHHSIDEIIRSSAIAGRCSIYRYSSSDSARFFKEKLNTFPHLKDSYDGEWETFCVRRKGRKTSDHLKILGIDVKSLYPFIMKNMYYPDGDIEFTDKFNPYKLGFYKVTVYDQGAVPLIPLRGEDGVLNWEFPYKYYVETKQLTKDGDYEIVTEERYNNIERILTSQDVFMLKRLDIPHKLEYLNEELKIVGFFFTNYNNVYYGRNLDGLIATKTKQDIYKKTQKINNIDERLSKRISLANEILDDNIKNLIIDCLENEKNDNYNHSIRETSKLILNSISGKPLQKNHKESYKMIYVDEENDKNSNIKDMNKKFYRKIDTINYLLDSDVEHMNDSIEKINIEYLNNIIKDKFSIFSPPGNSVLKEYEDCQFVKTEKNDDEYYDVKSAKPSQLGCCTYSFARTYFYTTGLCSQHDNNFFYGDTDSVFLSYGSYSDLLNKHVYIYREGPHVDFRVENISFSDSKEFIEGKWKYMHKYIGGEFGQYEPELLEFATNSKLKCRAYFLSKKCYYIHYTEKNGDVVIDNSVKIDKNGANLFKKLCIKIGFKGINLSKDRLLTFNQFECLDTIRSHMMCNVTYSNILKSRFQNNIKSTFDIDFKFSNNLKEDFQRLVFEVTNKLDSEFDELVSNTISKIEDYEYRLKNDINAKSNFKFDYLLDNIFKENPNNIKGEYEDKIFFLHTGLAKTNLSVTSANLIKIIDVKSE